MNYMWIYRTKKILLTCKSFLIQLLKKIIYYVESNEGSDLKAIFIGVICCWLFLSIQGGSYREVYATCQEGAGVGDDYYLSYKIYLDFGVPSLEETYIMSRFSSKEDAYVFYEKYKNFSLLNESTETITEDDGIYILEITTYSAPTLSTIEEYQEKITSLNKIENVCSFSESEDF